MLKFPFPKCATLMVVVMAATLLPAEASALLRYPLDTPGAQQLSSGSASLTLTTTDGAITPSPLDRIAVAPTARAGQSTTRALDLRYGVGDEGRGVLTGSVVSTFAPLTSELSDFTISAWVLDLTPRVESRLFRLLGASGAAIDFRLNGDRLRLSVSGSGVADAPLALAVPQSQTQWHFVAVSYQAATGQVTFYSGAEGGTLGTFSAVLLDGGGDPYVLYKNSHTLNIGNAGNRDQRRVDAMISDFQFFNTALTSQEVAALHASVIPEPGVALLLGAGVLALGVHRLARGAGAR